MVQGQSLALEDWANFFTILYSGEFPFKFLYFFKISYSNILKSNSIYSWSGNVNKNANENSFGNKPELTLR